MTKPDHEAAKKWAEDVLTRPWPVTEDTKNLSAAYLETCDATARLERAEALLKKLDGYELYAYTLRDVEQFRADIRAFLESKG